MKHPAVVAFLAAFACAGAADARGQVTVTTVHRFNGADGSTPRGRLIQATDGSIYGTTSVTGARGGGTVFRVAPDGTVTVVYALPGIDTVAGVIQGSDGNLYGVTRQGSDTRGNHTGLVFRVTPGGSYSELYRFPFAITSNGNYPVGELVESGPGVFYGTTESTFLGMREGTVFRITSAGAYSKLQDLRGSSQAGLVIGTDGNFYGTTSNVQASPGIRGSVFRVAPTGAQTTLHTFSGLDGSMPMAPLVLGSDGNFYGTTSGGGQFGLGTVFRITPTGVLSTLHSFNFSVDGSQPNGLTLGSDGNFYGTTRTGGPVVGHQGTIFRITPSGSLTTLHSFSVLGDGGYTPIGGLVQASDGTFYGTTSSGGIPGTCPGGCGTVFRFSLTGGAAPPSTTLAAPSALVASVSGSNVTLRWNGSPSATSYRLRAGATPGASNIFDGNVGNLTALTAAAPAGTYYVRVHAVGPGGESGPSNEVTVVVGGGGCTEPAAPTGLRAEVVGPGAAGYVVGLVWNRVVDATTYVLEAGSAPGLANLANRTTGPPAAVFVAANVPPGVYFVRVRAQNACGTSAASNEVIVSVGR